MIANPQRMVGGRRKLLFLQYSKYYLRGKKKAKLTLTNTGLK